MKNFYGKGNSVYVPAPAGGVVSGQPVVIGSLFGFAGMDAPAGAIFALHVVGEYYVTKVDNQAWAPGTPIYFDTTALNFTNVAMPTLTDTAAEIVCIPQPLSNPDKSALCLALNQQSY
jgi:predicted RecA/RadA family phage recombinase